MKAFKPKPNYFWSILSVAGVLFLLGVFGFITFHSQQLVQDFKEGFEISFELNPSTSVNSRDLITEALTHEEVVITESIKFISKEEGLELLSQDLGADLMSNDMPNPLFDVIVCNLTAEGFSTLDLDAFAERYRKDFTDVYDVHFERDLIQQITANMDRLSWFFLVAGAILIFFTYTLIHNSIRLSIYANRFLIRNMELVGASWGFIRAPFLRKSIRHGFASAVIAILVLSSLGLILWNQIPEVASYLQWEHLMGIGIVMIAVGMLINLSSTYFVVTRFLRMRVAELHQ